MLQIYMLAMSLIEMQYTEHIYERQGSVSNEAKCKIK
jgi:hypothetical protein